MIIEKCSQIEFDLCIWTYLGRWGTDVICVSAEMRFCLNHYLVKNVSFLRSLPARGVWIEITRARQPQPHQRQRRSPQGECGLKWKLTFHPLIQACRSPQGECGLKYNDEPRITPRDVRRSPQGECGLKFQRRHERELHERRSPQGECGLKYHRRGHQHQCRVAPRKGSVD